MSEDRRRGQVTMFIVVFSVALLLAVGLVVDGGRALAGRSRAAQEAQEAARAGAQHVDLGTYRQGTVVALDEVAARDAARAYLAATGDTGQVVVSGGHIHVTVHVVQPMRFLSAIGLSTLTVNGSGDADADQTVLRGGP